MDRMFKIFGWVILISVYNTKKKPFKESEGTKYSDHQEPFLVFGDHEKIKSFTINKEEPKAPIVDIQNKYHNMIVSIIQRRNEKEDQVLRELLAKRLKTIPTTYDYQKCVCMFRHSIMNDVDVREYTFCYDGESLAFIRLGGYKEGYAITVKEL